MSEYLCRAHIDVTSVPINNRSDFVLEIANYFNTSFVFFEQKKARVQVFPREAMDLTGRILKATKCYSEFKKPWLHSERKKNIFLFHMGKVSALEENIFTILKENIDIELPCVELKHKSTQERFPPILRKLINNAKKKKRHLDPRQPNPRRPSTLKAHSAMIYMTDDDEYVYHTTNSLQYCVANVIQPNARIHSGLDVHSDGGGSSQSSVRQTISSLGQNSFANARLENSFCSTEIDAATSLYSVADTVSSNGERNVEYPQRPRHPGFADYHKREATFDTWRQFVLFNIESLVRAGFYYTGEGTLVRCYFCGTELANLTPNDDPLVEHVRKLPSCGYLKSNLGQRRIEEYQARIRNGPINSQQTNDNPSRVTSRNPGSWSASDHIRSPQYQAYSIRLSTFARWPSDIRQRPEQVADAGFYYTGLEDIVRCFACDGGLKNWDPDDEPWIEHARWFQKCPFVKRVKGQEFIDHVKRMTEEEDEEEDAVVHSTFQPNRPALSNEPNSQIEQGKSEVKPKDELTMEETMDPSTVSGPSSQTTDSKRRLFEENQRLRKAMQCVACHEAKRDILLLPCMHLCLCSHCSEKTSVCPICSKEIREKMKTYVI